MLPICSSCNTAFTVFSVEIATWEPVNTNMELYKEMAHRLFQHKVISNMNVGNNRAFIENDRQLFGFDLHLANKHDQEIVTLENVENALKGILDSFEGYSEMRITHH